MIEESEKLEVRNLFHREGLSVGAIGKRTGRHHTTVKRILWPEKYRCERPKRVSAFEKILTQHGSYLRAKLEEYPQLKAPRIQALLAERGVRLGQHLIRRWLKEHRPKQEKSRAFLKLQFFPGEQAQVDWAHCGKLGGRYLYLFVIVLSYSRRLFARFYHSQNVYAVLSAHVKAFEYFGGVPATILYDNMRTAVVSRVGAGIEFQRELLEFASKYHFRPNACTPYAAWQKGRVERHIRFVRENFLAANSFTDIAYANEKIELWLKEFANQRPWPEDRSFTVDQVWQDQERQLLRQCPVEQDSIYEKQAASVSKTARVRFDSNEYTVPHHYASKSVVLFASEEELRVFDKEQEIARHRRSYGKNEDIQRSEHIEGLIRARRSLHPKLRQDYLHSILSRSELFFKKLALRGHSVQSAYVELHRLIPQYKLAQIDAAMQELIEKDIAGMDNLKHLLMHAQRDPLQEQVQKPAPVLKEQLAAITVREQELSCYDRFTPNQGA